ncbi:MAG TPA: inositol monophosphatase family protein, partial [Actinomycetota bacterium]|nr:inositol monophosphatase family protein [Actinomycetota bacterium]
MSYRDELSFAIELARIGGRIALGHYGRDPKSEKKADGTWVTEADWAAEAQIRLRIARTFPDHNILGEEEGLTQAGGGPPLEGAPTWVIDPIDGTNNFIAGIPIWATLVGLQVDGSSVVGVAHAPVLGETYDGAIGHGARVNGTPIKVDAIDSLEQAMFVYADPAAFKAAGLTAFFDAMTASAWRSRGLGDFWGHMLVARGAAHVMVEPELSVWDVAALQPIVT